MRSLSASCHANDQIVGLVPTMGALHEGHLHLVKTASAQSDVIVASIFVNPLQFNNPKDLQNYPRNEEKDLALLSDAGCHVVFIPEVEEFYPDQKNVLSMDFGEMATVMEGEFRRGHFSGVGVVVAKLFNSVSPDKAFFGKKDIQQLALVRKLVKDLSFPIEIVGVETVRDQNGLALSSRNQLLGDEDKARAAIINKSLNDFVTNLQSGNPIGEAKEKYMDELGKLDGFAPEYIEVVDEYTMKPVDSIGDSGSFAACTAVNVRGVRLIDNITF